MISRRTLVVAATAAGTALRSTRARADLPNQEIVGGLAELERRHGGRLGVAVLDTATGKRIAYRGDERFPLCSTFKCLAAAFVLARVDRGQERLDRRIVYPRSVLVPYSPVTGAHAGRDGLTVAEICEAAVTLSDNTAANLLLDSFGGPAGLTGYIRSLGDSITRLDRSEPALNEATPGDPRDTTTPVAMGDLLHRTVVGPALSASSRAQLAAWMMATKTGTRRLRAGLPPDWRVGDKTGTGDHNATNDVAVIWPPGRAPLIVTAYYVGATAPEDERSVVLSEVGRLAASA